MNEESTAGSSPSSYIEDGFEEKTAREWAMILHFSMFAGYLVPIAGFIAPSSSGRSRKMNYHPSMSTADWSPTGSSPVSSTASWDFS